MWRRDMSLIIIKLARQDLSWQGLAVLAVVTLAAAIEARDELQRRWWLGSVHDHGSETGIGLHDGWSNSGSDRCDDGLAGFLIEKASDDVLNGEVIRRCGIKHDDKLGSVYQHAEDSNTVSDPIKHIGYLYPAHLCPNIEQAGYALLECPFNPLGMMFRYINEQSNDLCVEVRKQVRGFKVGIAFELCNYVLAFLTEDILFHVHWAPTFQALPDFSAQDVVPNWPGFLSNIAAWIQHRRHSKHSNCDQAAFLLVQSSPEVFPSLENYTTSEIFHLTECKDRDFFEVFLSVYGKSLT
ncbi:hypothetical protein C8Q80DRAFT_1119391 [Daedaleopsis nitida]|nr:hypothetical protein C8Q80DRAFT_1119391 [Daedaleopsis nitida]